MTAFSAAKYDTMYYIKSALAGGICCGITHGMMTVSSPRGDNPPPTCRRAAADSARARGGVGGRGGPALTPCSALDDLPPPNPPTPTPCSQPVDVVKTRIQLEPATYNKGMVGSFKQIIAAEGAGALLTGLGATFGGYFVQGWFKFGGVEFFKINMASYFGEQVAWDNRTSIYLASAAGAEFIADLFLCPLEAVRIRSVSDPKFPQSLGGGFAHILKNEGVLGFYAGLGPILFKQIPYTMAKFAVQGKAAELMCVPAPLCIHLDS